MVNLILPKAPLKLLRFLSLRWSEPQESTKTKKVRLFCSPRHKSRFSSTRHPQIPQISSNNFKIKYADDAVVDLVALLDWINGDPSEAYRIAIIFCACHVWSWCVISWIFEFLNWSAFCTGKLVQVGSKPAWIPTQLRALCFETSLPSRIIPVTRLKPSDFSMNSAFPGLSSTNTEPFRLCSHAEIRLYLTRITRLFNVWKSRAWEQYYAGLSVFLSDRIPRDLTLKLLRPLEPVTAAKIAANTLIKTTPSSPRSLPNLAADPRISFTRWAHQTAHFHHGPVPLDTNYTLFHCVAKSASSLARTCFHKLFVYLVDPQLPQQALTEYPTQSLLMSIHNYQGFGNI